MAAVARSEDSASFEAPNNSAPSSKTPTAMDLEWLARLMAVSLIRRVPIVAPRRPLDKPTISVVGRSCASSSDRGAARRRTGEPRFAELPVADHDLVEGR